MRSCRARKCERGPDPTRKRQAISGTEVFPRRGFNRGFDTRARRPPSRIRETKQMPRKREAACQHAAMNTPTRVSPDLLPFSVYAVFAPANVHQTTPPHGLDNSTALRLRRAVTRHLVLGRCLRLADDRDQGRNDDERKRPCTHEPLRGRRFFRCRRSRLSA